MKLHIASQASQLMKYGKMTKVITNCKQKKEPRGARGLTYSQRNV